MQLNLLDNNKVNKFKLKELHLSNYKRVHTDNVLKFTKDINIIMPNYSNSNYYSASNIKTGLDFEVYSEHVDRLYLKDAIEMIQIIKNERNFDLWDYSFFANNKEISIKAIIEQEGTQKEFVRKQKYRGEEVFGQVIGTTKTGRLQLAKYEDKEYENIVLDSIVRDIVIYPKELPVMLKVQYTKNFNYLIEKYPLLDIKRFVEDTNYILNKFSIPCELIFKKDKIEIVDRRSIDLTLKNDKILSKTFKKLSKELDELTMDILFDTNQKYSEKHLELALIIALEKQLNNDVIVFTNSMLNCIYEDELDTALLMLTEFIKNNQQVIMFYDSPYDHSQIDNVLYTMESFNSRVGYKLYNNVWFTEKFTSEEEWGNVTIKMNARELIERYELSYEDKKKLSKKIIKDAILNNVQDYSKMAIGFSYGKDSLALLILVKESIDELNEDINEKIPYPKIVFCNSQVEFPETYQYKKKFDLILKEWGFEIFSTKPLTSFWDIVEKDGFPMFGKAIRKNKNPEIFDKIEKLGIKTCGNKCCLYLKEIPSKILYEELGIVLTFVGILAEESNTRKTRWYGLGDTYWNKTEGMYKSQPLIHFTEDDVWQAIKESGLPYNHIYDTGYWKSNEDGSEDFVKYKRSGCWCCSMSINFQGNNMEMLRNTHPKLWDLIMNKKGLAKEIFKFKHNISEGNWSEMEVYMLERYLESKPCHFDSTNLKIS